MDVHVMESLSMDGGETIVNQVLSSSNSDSLGSIGSSSSNSVASVATKAAEAIATATAAAAAAAGGFDSSKQQSDLLTTATSDFKHFMGVDGFLERPSLSFPYELKILCILIVIFLFLLFLIMMLWDRYGNEIGQLYTPNGIILTTSHDARGQEETTTTNVHDVADEYSIYQKLPTFFYEYAHAASKKKKR